MTVRDTNEGSREESFDLESRDLPNEPEASFPPNEGSPDTPALEEESGAEGLDLEAAGITSSARQKAGIALALALGASIAGIAVWKGTAYFTRPTENYAGPGQIEKDSGITERPDASVRPKEAHADNKDPKPTKEKPVTPVPAAPKESRNVFNCEITRLQGVTRIQFSANCTGAPGPVSVISQAEKCTWKGKGKRKTLQDCRVKLKINKAELTSGELNVRPASIGKPRKLGKVQFKGKN